jgi:hypothetical protein
LERDAGALTAANPYTGTNQLITNYLADPTEEAILHLVNADPARTPTFAMFARPDYFLSSGPTNCNSPCVSVNPAFAYNHGDYAAEIDTTFLGLAGPGVKNLGVQDGPKPLSVRVWTCAACGTRHDRDVNAAINILAAGRADRLNACGGDVRPGSGPAVASEAGTHQSAA